MSNKDNKPTTNHKKTKINLNSTKEEAIHNSSSFPLLTIFTPKAQSKETRILTNNSLRLCPTKIINNTNTIQHSHNHHSNMQ